MSSMRGTARCPLVPRGKPAPGEAYVRAATSMPYQEGGWDVEPNIPSAVALCSGD